MRSSAGVYRDIIAIEAMLQNLKTDSMNKSKINMGMS
jgi:hypothetical protein